MDKFEVLSKFKNESKGLQNKQFEIHNEKNVICIKLNF